MSFLILDIYPSDSWRLVKDTAGGYGTGNNFGNNLLGKIFNYFVSKTISMPPMSAIYIHSILKSKGFQVNYTRKIPKKTILESYDYIIMPSSIISHETEVRVLKDLTNNGFRVFVIGIFGNVKKSAYKMKNSFVVPGEPESFFMENDFDVKSLEKFFLDENKNYLGKPFVENLDKIPFPSWDDYLNKYPLRNNFLEFNSKDAIPLLATRGCPYSCFNYCTYPLQQGRKVRFRSVENIISEIKKWKSQLGSEKFIFRDPVFSINRKHTVDLCEKIINSKKKFKIGIETHLKNIDDDLAHLLKKAGVNLVYVGIESSDMDVKKDASRISDTDINQVLKINYLEKIGIKVKSMYIVGLPADTKDTYKNTFNYAKKINSTYAQFNVFTPYPGTPVFKEYEKKITAKEYQEFTQNELVFDHKILSKKDIFEMLDNSYVSYYTNPKWLLKFLFLKIRTAFNN